MRKKYKILIFTIIVVVTLCFGYFFGRALLLEHKTKFHYTEYLWLFKDSIRRDIDTLTAIGDVRKTDIQATYNYKSDFHITIWEFKELYEIDINKIRIQENVLLENVQFSTGEGLNKNSYPFPYTLVRFKLPFHNYLQVNLNHRSEVFKPIQLAHGKGFWGKIDRMSFSNKEGEHLLLFDYLGGKTLTLFFMYKINNHFFAILVNSDKPFDESIINIFNLS